MNCEKCQKNRATYHLTAIEKDVSGKEVKREIHLCDECARRSGAGSNFYVSIGDVLGSLTTEPKTPRVSSAKCPECGITYGDFKAKARLGCANDYEVFRNEILRLLEKIHGATTHAGKTPQTVDSQVRMENELLKLNRELSSMVKCENFEKAAEIRDRIKTLENDLKR